VKKKSSVFAIFGVFNADDWLYAALLEQSRKKFIPIVLLPSHRFYLDILNNPKSSPNACGPYYIMVDAWRSMGVELKSISLLIRPNEENKPTCFAALRLFQKNDIGTQIGIIHVDLPEAVILHALTDIPIHASAELVGKMGVDIFEYAEDDADILNDIETQMNIFKKSVDLSKDLSGESDEIEPPTGFN